MLASPFRRRSLTWLIGLVVLLWMATGLAGRGSPHPAPSPTTVRVLMPAPFADATADPVARFNREHQRLRIEVVRGPLDTEAVSDLAIGSLLLGDTPYDLLMVDVTWTAKYAAAGWLAPLEPWLGDGALDGMVEGARLGSRFGGHLWRLPINGDTGLLYWRTDLMDRPPRTTEELETVARRLQRQGKVRWGYIWQGRQYEGLSCVFLEVLHGFGGHWWSPDGTPAGRTDLAAEPATAAADWLSSLVRTGITPGSVANFAENDALQLFAAGDAAFLRNWPYAWAEIARSGGPVVGKVGVTTMVGAPGQAGGGTLGSWGLALLAGSRHPGEAVEVMRWLAGPETQRELTLRYGYAPTWSSLYEDVDLKRAQPLLAVQRQALDGALVRPPTPLYAQLSDVVQRQLSAVITGQVAAGAAMAAAQDQSEGLFLAAGGFAAGPATRPGGEG